MGCELEHILWDPFVWYALEIRLLAAHFVGIAQRHAEQSFATRLQRHVVLARCEDDLSERNHPFLADSLANDCKSLRSDLAFRHDVVWLVQVELVDLGRRHK